MSLEKNLYLVRERIEQAARRVGRNPEEITLVGVCKTVEREKVEEAFRLGLTDFGENRIASAEGKFIPLPYPEGQAKLHLIGHLQTNKARRAAALCDFVHSVDSLKIAQALDRHCFELGKSLPILLEVNVSGEQTKYGLKPAELDDVIEQILPLRHLRLRGLMTLAPFEDEPEQTRPVFRKLKKLFESYSNDAKIAEWHDLSIGMTNDFEVAIEEGATIVRVGRALFE